MKDASPEKKAMIERLMFQSPCGEGVMKARKWGMGTMCGGVSVPLRGRGDESASSETNPRKGFLGKNRRDWFWVLNQKDKLAIRGFP